jgi:hypothetical protein
VTLTITSQLIRSPATPHTAELVGHGGAAGWRVSWLPDLLLPQAQGRGGHAHSRGIR